jgi:hypothetical protein
VEKLAHIQCTHVEIATALGVSVDTLTRNQDFAETFKRGSEGGRKSLRRMQFESANRGNVTMQIWLGKQYLAQTDHSVNEVRRVPVSGELTLSELGDLVADYFSKHPEFAPPANAVDTNYGMASRLTKPLLLPRPGSSG